LRRSPARPIPANHAERLRRRGEGGVIEPWVSVEEAARHLGVVKESIYRWIDAKGLPARKVGKLWKLKLSEVDAWVRAGGAAAPDDGDGARAKTQKTSARRTSR
jgi:excisionase family DNA binding protein